MRQTGPYQASKKLKRLTLHRFACSNVGVQSNETCQKRFDVKGMLVPGYYLQIPW